MRSLGGTTLLSLLALALAGCAYPKAIKRAEALVEQGDYRGALAQYDRALSKRPRSADAAAGRAETIGGAIAEALADAEATLAAADYEGSLRHVAYIQDLDPGHAEAARVRVEVGDALLAEAEEAIGREQWEEGYARAARARDLVGDRLEVAPLLARVRSWFFARSDEALEGARYREALGYVDIVGRHEPDQRDEVSRRGAAVRDAWATVVAAEAGAREAAGQIGPALAWRRRAIEIAGRSVDVDAASRLAATLRARGTLPVRIDWTGDGGRTGGLAAVVEAEVGRIAGVVRGEGGLGASVDAPVAWCSETYTPWTAEQPYVSGQREVPNPQRAVVEDRLGWARNELAAAAPAEEAARGAAHQAEAAVANARAALQPLEADLAKVRDHHDRATHEVDSGRRMVADLVAQQAHLEQTDPNSAALAAVVITLGNVRARLMNAEDDLARAEQRRAELQPAADQASQALAGAREAAMVAVAEHQRAANRRSTAESQVGTLSAELAATPATLWEDVVDVFWYEVQRWTRVCEGEVTVRAWGPGLEGWQERFVDAQQTTDDAHPAWPQYGVALDPLGYPTGDAALVAAFDARIGPAVSDSLGRAIGAVRAADVVRARAQLDADPDAGLGALLSVALAAPWSIDGDTRAVLARHLGERYELEDPDAVLR
jgi:hypothetical protein